MPNLDNPRGFHPHKTANGGPWVGNVRTAVPGGAGDIFMFDPIYLTSGLVEQINDTGDTILGVAIGFGTNNTVAGSMGNSADGMSFDPTNLETGSRYFDDSASTNTEWNVFYVVARDVMFFAQDDSTSGSFPLARGANHDITITNGNVTTGIGACEIDANSTATGGFTIMGPVRNVENDVTVGNGLYYGYFTTTN